MAILLPLHKGIIILLRTMFPKFPTIFAGTVVAISAIIVDIVMVVLLPLVVIVAIQDQTMFQTMFHTILPIIMEIKPINAPMLILVIILKELMLVLIFPTINQLNINQLNLQPKS
jgi:hypothetical protein